MTEIPKLNLSLKKNNSSEQINNQNSGHSRVSSSDTNSSHDEGMLSPHGSSNANSTGTLGVSGGNSVISQFVEPLNHTKKSNASIHWRCVHVLEHPDFEMNALDDESSYHTSLQLLPFTIVDTVTQKSRYAIVHGSKRGVSVLELVEEFTQATDNRTGTQWTIKYHTKLESNGFGSSAVMLRKSSNKEKLIFFGGYFHENQETSDKSSLFQSQQRYSNEAVNQNRTLTSRMKKLFKSSKNDVAACPHPTNMFFQYKFNTHEFKLFVAGEENTSSSNNNGNTISKKPSFLNSAANFWPTVHANHTVLAISKDLFIFGGNYLKWNDLTQDSSNSVSDATKKVSFVYVFDLKKKKFDQPKLPSFSIPKQASHDSSQASVSTSYSASSSTDSLGDGTMHPIHIPLPIEDVDTKQKERRSNLLDSIKLFGRERKGSIHDHRQLSTDIRDIAPPNRFGHSVINVNGIAYVYGGRLRKPYLSGHPDQVNPYSDESVYSYNFKSSQFTRLKIKSLEKPHPRMFHAMVEIPENNCFLMMGGHSANEKVLDDEGLSMMMEDSQSSTSSTTTPTLKYFSDCYLFDILRGEWTLVKQKGHLPLCAETECRSPVALARTKDGNFLCVVKNGQSGSLEVYEGKLSF